jgi:hypothetical protein
VFCQECGKETPENATFCISCGARLTDVRETTRTRLGTAAGIITIIDGGLKSALAVFMTSGCAMHLAEGEYEKTTDGLVLLLVSAALGILAIVGGISALQRRRWGLALAGAIAAMLPLFPLGIASVILIGLAKSNGEFEQPQTQGSP